MGFSPKNHHDQLGTIQLGSAGHLFGCAQQLKDAATRWLQPGGVRRRGADTQVSQSSTRTTLILPLLSLHPRIELLQVLISTHRGLKSNTSGNSGSGLYPVYNPPIPGLLWWRHPWWILGVWIGISTATLWCQWELDIGGKSILSRPRLAPAWCTPLFWAQIDLSLIG